MPNSFNMRRKAAMAGRRFLLNLRIISVTSGYLALPRNISMKPAANSTVTPDFQGFICFGEAMRAWNGINDFTVIAIVGQSI